MRIAAVALACALSTPAWAANPDCSTIRIVVPYPAGGAADVGARLLGEQVGAKLGKTFVVENKVGASGNLGTEAVVGATQDGCTLLVNTSTIATFPDSFGKLRFNPFKDLVVLSAIGTTPTFIVTANKTIADLKGLQAWSAKNPNGLSYGSTGYGLFAHLAVEELASKTGSKFLHVPYRGGAQATTDMISGRLDFGSFAAGSVLAFVKQQQIKVLAAIQPQRSILAPEVQSIAEQGIPEIDATLPFMFFAPAGTPPATVSSLSAELNEAAAKPEISAKLLQLGFEPLKIGPAEGAAIMRKTADHWAPVIKRLGIKIE
jgi:tripartite-type tricarboxylate transporter receptor subunit TctC